MFLLISLVDLSDAMKHCFGVRGEVSTVVLLVLLVVVVKIVEGGVRWDRV